MCNRDNACDIATCLDELQSMKRSEPTNQAQMKIKL